ncbi:hypothetical protein D3C83_220610 [compost metagenome]
MAPAAVEAVEALGRHALHAHAGALGLGGEVADARIAARLVDEDLDHGLRVGSQPGQHGMEAEDDAGLLHR